MPSPTQYLFLMTALGLLMIPNLIARFFAVSQRRTALVQPPGHASQGPVPNPWFRFP